MAVTLSGDLTLKSDTRAEYDKVLASLGPNPALALKTEDVDGLTLTVTVLTVTNVQ